MEYCVACGGNILDAYASVDGNCSHGIKRLLLFGRNVMTNLDSVLKSRDIQRFIQSYGFSSSQVWLWELDHIEGWVVKNWCLRIVVLEKTLESPWDSKDIKPVNPKGSQPWIFIGRTVLKLKLLYFSHLMWRANSLEKTMMLGKTEAGGEGGFTEWDGWMASLTQ